MEAPAGGRNLEIVLLHELSSGTFARLYLAEARAPGGIDRIVAVKILREQWNESTEVINRTRDEARLLARLRHKNILRVEDLTEIEGQLAIIMEFVDGLDLKQLVEALAKRGQRLPPRAALQIAAEAAAALEAAYFKIPYGLDSPLHVVHRDIKPSNVMVSVEGELKVLDFGTARSSQAFRSVQTGALRFGSLKYMSPERREGDRGEHSADVYALGLMLLEILKGEWLPLLPMDIEEHDQVVTEEVGKLGSLGMPNREWDIALRQVLIQMLAGDAPQRPNAEQVAKLFRAFAEQASGSSLDTFAQEHVAPLAREIRGHLTGGSLAGTRFVVNHFSSDQSAAGRPAGAVASKPSASSAGDARARAASPAPLQAQAAQPAARSPAAGAVPFPAPARAPNPDRSVEIASPRGQAARAPAPAERPEPRAEPRAEPRPSAADTLPSTAVPYRPRIEVSHAVDEPEDEPPPRGNGMAMAAGGVLVLLALGCAGIVAVGGAWYVMSGRPASSPVAAMAPAMPAAATPGPASTPGLASSTPAAPTPPTGGGAASPTGTTTSAAGEPLSVTMDGTPVQWIRVHTVLGQEVLAGAESLDGALPADTYELAMKQVGRPALKGSLKLAAGGATLVCAAAKDTTVRCTGVEPPLVLKP
jgi:serine/threonine-protein kinase